MVLQLKALGSEESTSRTPRGFDALRSGIANTDRTPSSLHAAKSIRRSLLVSLDNWIFPEEKHLPVKPAVRWQRVPTTGAFAPFEATQTRNSPRTFARAAPVVLGVRRSTERRASKSKFTMGKAADDRSVSDEINSRFAENPWGVGSKAAAAECLLRCTIKPELQSFGRSSAIEPWKTSPA